MLRKNCIRCLTAIESVRVPNDNDIKIAQPVVTDLMNLLERVHCDDGELMGPSTCGSMNSLGEWTDSWDGWGYRTYEASIAARITNGCDNEYTDSASQCKTPTAVPGTSRHEQGFAIDFYIRGSRFPDLCTNGSITVDAETDDARVYSPFGFVEFLLNKHGFVNNVTKWNERTRENEAAEPWHWVHRSAAGHLKTPPIETAKKPSCFVDVRYLTS